jgi:hypothetical protein
MRGCERLIGWRHTTVALAVAGTLGGVGFWHRPSTDGWSDAAHPAFSYARS